MQNLSTWSVLRWKKYFQTKKTKNFLQSWKKISAKGFSKTIFFHENWFALSRKILLSFNALVTRRDLRPNHYFQPKRYRVILIQQNTWDTFQQSFFKRKEISRKIVIFSVARFESVSLWILRNFYEHFFYRTPLVDCF